MATEFKLPEVGEGITGGTVVNLLVSVGDEIERDQPVLELETDKAVVEVPSTVTGVIESINVKENEEAKIGQVVLTVGENGVAAAEKKPAEAPEESKEEPQEESQGEKGETKSTEAPAEEKPAAPSRAEARAPQAESAEVSDRSLIPAAPSVRRLARELGVDLGAISGSGILGRISAEDVRRYASGAAPQAGPAAPEAPPLPDFGKYGEVERQPMSNVRKATVRSMTAAWTTVPMVTQFDKADVTELEKLRKQYQPKADKLGAKLTPTAILLKVVSGALRKFPDFNASLDVQKSEIIYKKYINIGVAVDTERGLLVPVVKHADRKNALQLAVELGELAAKARERKLGPQEMQGGNFSISNLGGIGGTGFTPIVASPEVAILGVSRSAFEPLWDAEAGQFKPRLFMPLALTYDHRLIDGAAAARFLRWVCEALEDPFLLALEG